MTWSAAHAERPSAVLAYDDQVVLRLIMCLHSTTALAPAHHRERMSGLAVLFFVTLLEKDAIGPERITV